VSLLLVERPRQTFLLGLLLLAAAGSAAATAEGTTTLTGSGTLTAAATREAEGTAGLGGSGTLVDGGTREAEGAAALSGSGTLGAHAANTLTATAALAGTGTLGATGFRRGAGASSSSIYMVRAVDVNGTAYAEFVNATITSVTWVLNSWGGCTFSIPTGDPAAKELRNAAGWFREVQIWRDPLDGSPPKLIFWGPIVRARATGLSVECQAMGLLWYLSRLTFGPILVEHLANADFEAGLAGWTNVGTSPSVDTSIVYRGTKSLKLVQATQGTDTYVYQRFTHTAGPVEPDWFFVAASVWQVATVATPYVGPAYQQRGLYVKVSVGGSTVSEVWTPLDNGAPRNVWTRIYAPIAIVPAGATALIEVRLYSPGGEVHWDCVTARLEESTGSNTAVGTAPDLNVTLANVLAYAQSAAANNPDLNIDPPTGVFGLDLFRQYQFYDLGNIWTACFADLIASGACDVDIVWNNAGTKRQLVIWPRKGTARPELTLEMGGNVVDFSYDQDGQATAGAVVVIPKTATTEPVLGTVQPAAQFFGYAVDAAANGGMCFGAVESAVIETPASAVDQRAVAEVARLKELVTIPTLVVKENRPGTIIGVLGTGDTVPVIIDYGFVQENTTRRVTAMTLDPNSETLSVVCGVVLPGTGTALSNLPPTIGGQIAAGALAVADVVRSTRTVAPNFAQLANTDLHTMTNAQTPVYDQATGHLVARNPYDIIFNLPGAVSVSTSPGVPLRDPMSAVGLSVHLDTPGSTTTTVNLLKNGAVVATVSLAATVAYAYVAISPAVAYAARSDTYALSVSAAGTGAAGLGGGIEIG